MKDKDAIIEELVKQNTFLMETITILEKENIALREKIDRLSKDSGNSSLPPSSDIVKPKPKTSRKKVKRKRGGQPGHKKHTRKPFTPEQIDHTIEYELNSKDSAGLEPLDDWHVIQQITLPEKLYYVTEHKARKYLDPQTGEIVIAALPEDVSKGGLFGGDITALVAYLKGDCHMSFTTIQSFLKEILGVKVSRGYLSKIIKNVSKALAPSYQELMEKLPNEANIGIDETGHKDNGKKHWTWAFQTTEYTLFHIDKSRGSQVLFDILGKDFTGIINSDFYGAYRKFCRLTEAVAQFCMAHLIREIRFLAEMTDKKLSKWGKGLLNTIKKMFNTLHNAEEYTTKGYISVMKRIKDRFLDKVRRPPDHKLAKKLCRRFKGKAAEDYFRFLVEPDIEPTNNGTEREIRHTVIDRRITQGTRGSSGMRRCERIWTTIATCKKQNQNVFEFIHNSILAHWNNETQPKLL